MKPERWRDIEQLYHAARDRQPEERAAFLRKASGGDETLRAMVESLLARRDEAADFMESPAPALGGHPGATLDTSSNSSSYDAAPPRGFFRRRPWWVWCCTSLTIAVVGSLYWVILAGPQPLGWVLAPVTDDASGMAWLVRGVAPGSAAEHAGLEVHDIVTGVEMKRLLERSQLDAPHRLEVMRRGERKALTLTAARKDLPYWLGREGRRHLLLMGTSALYLVLAGVLLFSRPRDRGARWGTLLVVQLGLAMLYLAVGPLRPFSPDVSHAIRALPLPVGILALLGISFCGMSPAGAFGFAAVFPRPLPLSNHLWWLFLLAPAVTIPIDLHWLWLPVYGSAGSAAAERPLEAVAILLGAIFYAGALALLAYSYRRLESRNERRRLRIVAFGFGFTFFALSINMLIATPWAPLEEIGVRYQLGSEWQLLESFLFAAAPICTTYAILRHRVFDIHVIIRLGLRYAAARGVLLSIVPVTGLVLALDVLSHRSQPVREILAQRGPLYAVLSVAALVLHVKRKAWMEALDRRFFRERYDAYRLLSGVADDVRRSVSFDEAARHVIAKVDGALHLESVSLMIRHPGEAAYRSAAAINDPVPSIPADARLVALARVLNKPLENQQSGTGWLAEQLPRAEVNLLRGARVEWLFPVLLGGTGPEAFLLLGPKRSEEPYSREDRMMLGAIAASLGLLLEKPPASTVSGFAECPECGTCYDPGSVRCDSDDGTLMKSPYSRTLAGRYRLDRRLGRGGMGSVYEAFDSLLERHVALKVIRQEWMASADAVARFRREAKAAASFSHAHVVTVYDFGVSDDDRAYLVMELLKGGTLRKELRERVSLEPKRTLEILRGVSAAVATAHERRLLHRDLKPENVFLARSADGEVAKVLDFGLVKPLGSTHTESMTGTAPGVLVGTLAYMSPEQRAGEAPAEGWDIWALTVMAFEMLTGVHPFAVAGDPRPAIVGGSNVTSPVRVTTLSAPAAAFFERALATDPTRRPASVRQLIVELETVL